MRTVLSVAAIFLVACSTQPGLWQWHHPDAKYAEDYRARDIAECEEYAQVEDMDGRGHLLKPARDYGGWGDFAFEFCMKERGWNLESVQPEP